MVAWVQEVRDSEGEEEGMDERKKKQRIKYARLGDWINMAKERKVREERSHISVLVNRMVSVPCQQANSGPLQLGWNLER